MLLTRIAATGVLAVGAVLASGAASAQSYPQRPVRVITAEPGGGTDITIRMVSPDLSAKLGQQVVVDNRGGGGGIVAADIVAKAPPDGYTLLYYTSAVWLLPLMRSNLSYDPIKSFTPVIQIVNSPSVMVVHPSVAATSVKELIALAKAKPGALNYGSGGSGTAPHLMAELFKSMAGVNIVRVAYRGVGFAITDLVAGQIQLVIATDSAVGQHVRSGRLRALAVTSAQATPLVPGLPPIADTVPGYEATAMFGLLAPAHTPAAIVNRLNRELAAILARPDMKEKFVHAGVETAGGSPEQFAATIKSEMERMGKVIKAAGIRAD